MNKSFLPIAALAAISMGALHAQDITGTWQGTLSIQRPQGAVNLRTVIKISKSDDNSLRAVMYSIDQGPQPMAGAVTHQGSVVKIALPAINGAYEGKLDGDGVNLTGTWTQGPGSNPLNLKRVTDKEAWAIPTPPPVLKPMAGDYDPSFEVATVKVNPNGRGRLYQLPAREFNSHNTSLTDLIVFAYNVHSRQIEGLPSWADSIKYDVNGKADGEGKPSQQQWRIMLQKLLADRFQLAFHREKKEISVYAIVVAKGGPKMTESVNPNGQLGLVFRGAGNLPARNATMAQCAGVMQSAVMDRPVVDQTGLTAHYDFQLTWTPDETQFGGLRPPAPPEDNPNAPPDLFTAMQEQLGLKMQVAKAPVDVLVIERAGKPSEN
jgi:uncharacterized protein (TIGR03435 family)